MPNLNTFEFKSTYNHACDECGSKTTGQLTRVLMVKGGVEYYLCPTCFKLFIGELYKQETQTFNELIRTLYRNDPKGFEKMLKENG